MAIATDTYVLHDVLRVKAFDIATGELLAIIKENKSLSISNENEVIYATGQNGANIAAFDRNKKATITGSSGVITEGLLALQLGSAVEKTNVKVRNFMDVLTVTATEATTSFEAVGTTGAEIKYIYKYVGGVASEKFVQGSTASATEFAYAPATKKITLPTGKFQAGDKIVVFYDYVATSGKRITNSSNKMPKTVRLSVECMFLDPCTEKDYFGYITADRAKTQGNFALEIGDQPGVHNYGWELLSAICDETKKDFYDIVIVDQ